MTITIFEWLLGLSVLVLVTRRLLLRLQLSRAKHRSLAGHARLGRLLARFVPYYEYDEAQFFRADDAPEEIGEQRRAAFRRLAALYAQRFANTVRRPLRSRMRSPIYNSRRATAYHSSSAVSFAGTLIADRSSSPRVVRLRLIWTATGATI